jgi:hypothetical protein
MTKTPNTISDKDWRSIQDRARKANPKLDDTLSTEATARRIAGSQQLDAAKRGRN